MKTPTDRQQTNQQCEKELKNIKELRILTKDWRNFKYKIEGESWWAYSIIFCILKLVLITVECEIQDNKFNITFKLNKYI